MGFIAQLIAGPILGLIGSWVNAWIAYKGKKLDLEAQQLKQDHETALTKLNIEARGKEMENEQWIAQTHAMADMLKGSYEHDASYGPLSPKHAVWLRWVRPALTFSLVGLAGLIYFTVNDDGVIRFANGDVMTAQERVIGSILMMAEAATTWWFADRRGDARK